MILDLKNINKNINNSKETNWVFYLQVWDRLIMYFISKSDKNQKRIFSKRGLKSTLVCSKFFIKIDIVKMEWKVKQQNDSNISKVFAYDVELENIKDYKCTNNK